jgi:hypothetical protein
MTTVPTPTPAPVEKTSAVVVVPHKEEEIRIYSHSTILYWWPVWVAGFIMAMITYSEGSRAAIVPHGASYDPVANVIRMPDGHSRIYDNEFHPMKNGEIGERLARSKNVGVIFSVILLIVVFITNVPLRGLWSLIALLAFIAMSVTFAWLGIWGKILDHLGQISLHMNMGFYMFFSTLLFILWAAVVFGFDRTHYWKFRPGQLTYESLFGGGQKTYDTSGMAFEKLRDDLFRHWLLGLGSGDLVIITSGAQRENFQIHNVMFLDRILNRLQMMIAERNTVNEQ